MSKENHIIQIYSDKLPISYWDILSSTVRDFNKNIQGAGLGTGTPPTGDSGAVEIYFENNSLTEAILFQHYSKGTKFREVILISQFFRGKRTDLMTDQHVAIFNGVVFTEFRREIKSYTAFTYNESNISKLSFPELFQKLGNIFK